MRNLTFYNWARVAAVLAMVFTVASCGKDDGKKKKKGATTIIQSAEIDGAGNATFSFSSDSGSAEFFCRVDTLEAQGEWYPCNGGSTTYNIPEGQTIIFWVKNGANGQPVRKELSYTETLPPPAGSIDPDDNSGAYPEDDGVWNLAGLNFGLLPIGNEHGFAVPEGKRIVRYSVQAGLQNDLTVFKLIDPFDPLAEVSHLTPCGGGAFPAETIPGRSTPNGPVSQYCKYHPSLDGQKQFEKKEMAANHLEIGNEAGGPIDFAAVSVFSSALDQVYTKRLFIKHCGIPGDYDQHAVTPQGMAVPRGTHIYSHNGQLPSDFYTMLANGQIEEPVSYRGYRPLGFIMGGTFYNLPGLNKYYPGELPDRTVFHWCIRDVNFVTQQGIPSKRLFIGSFEVEQLSNTGGPATKKRVEYHLIQEMDSRMPYEFANAAAQSALSTIFQTTPQRSNTQHPGYPGGQYGPINGGGHGFPGHGGPIYGNPGPQHPRGPGGIQWPWQRGPRGSRY